MLTEDSEKDRSALVYTICFCWVKVTLSICHASRSMSQNIPKGALKLDQVGIVYFFVGRCTRIPTFPKVNVYVIFMLHLVTIKEGFPFNILYLEDAYLASCINKILQNKVNFLLDILIWRNAIVRPYSILLCYYYEVFVSNCKICMLSIKDSKNRKY